MIHLARTVAILSLLLLGLGLFVPTVDAKEELPGTIGVNSWKGNQDMPNCISNCQCSGGRCDMPKCGSNCQCSSGGCSMPSCTTNCQCSGGGCDMVSCTWDCQCSSGLCDMSVCSMSCGCSAGNCGPDGPENWKMRSNLVWLFFLVVVPLALVGYYIWKRLANKKAEAGEPVPMKPSFPVQQEETVETPAPSKPQEAEVYVPVKTPTDATPQEEPEVFVPSKDPPVKGEP